MVEPLSGSVKPVPFVTLAAVLPLGVGEVTEARFPCASYTAMPTTRSKLSRISASSPPREGTRVPMQMCLWFHGRERARIAEWSRGWSYQELKEGTPMLVAVCIAAITVVLFLSFTGNPDRSR